VTYVSNPTGAEKTVSQIRALGSKAVAIPADVRLPESGALVVKQTLSAFNATGIDILVNNAAVVDFLPFENITPEVFARTFDGNVLGPIALIQAVLPVIRKGGRIINVTSKASRVAMGGLFALYASSKAALDILTRNMALEYAGPKSITVNNIMPGPIDTGKWGTW
jgi:3-oxoacyl-[acyl-carrier protein] reductase